MRSIIFFVILVIVISCSEHDNIKCQSKSLKVIATAYNSLKYQTSSNPNITAFGDSLYPGLNYIAVSRDLLDSGLVHNTEVKIQGFDSTFIVKDKMNKRWRNRIDIYMGVDIKKAKKWGKKQVTIDYCMPNKTKKD